MSLPTDGYTPGSVRYSAHLSFVGDINIELHGDGTGTAPPEEFVTVLDAALPGLISDIATALNVQPSAFVSSKTQTGEIVTPVT
jgi:hypothetical protein